MDELDNTSTQSAFPHKQVSFQYKMMLVIMGSYLIDAVILSGFAYNGKVSFLIPLFYFLLGSFEQAVSYMVYKNKWHLKVSEKNIAFYQILFSIFIQNFFLYISPNIGLFFLFNIFNVFSLSLISLNTRQYIVIFLMSFFVTALAILNVGSSISLPLDTKFDQILLIATFGAVLSRIAYLNAYVYRLRLQLSYRNKELKGSLKKIEELASHDELTKAPNRRQLMISIKEHIMQAEKNSHKFTLAIMDIDHFKKINDTHGHLTGDEVLKKFARYIMKEKRKVDIFGRYGGEEFIMLLSDTVAGDAYIPLERMRKYIEDLPWHKIHSDMKVTCSIGASEYKYGDSVEDLLGRADTALYAAKNTGRNKVRIEYK